MAAAAPIAVGLSMASTLTSAYGEAQGQKYKAAQSKAAADAGRAAADQTDTTLTNELNTTLSSIKAIRASAGMSNTSGTAIAIMDNERKTQDRTRRIEVGNIQRQARQDDADARFLKQSAKVSLLGGAMKSAGIGLKGYAA